MNQNALWVIRICFLLLCSLAGYAVSELQPELIVHPFGLIAGFGLGGLIIAVDEMLKGFSLRAFSAATFGLLLGFIIAWLIDQSQLFKFTAENTRWIIRLAAFLGCGYIGIILAMRSNKEDFSLIIPYVRFKSQHKPENFIVLDTNVIIDGRVADLIDAKFIEGIIVVPRVVLRELQLIADSSDTIRRGRGRRGLEMLNRIQRNDILEVKIHEADFPDDTDVDSKIVRLAKALGATLYTNDYNLGELAELQSVRVVNLTKLAHSLKPVVLPGEILDIRIAREGKDKGQGIGYLPDGTMVVVNQGNSLIGRSADVQVQTLHQTGAGIIIFADLKVADAA